MRVQTLTIIAMGEPDDDEIMNGAKALFRKCTKRASYRPRTASLLVLNSICDAFQRGRDNCDAASLRESCVHIETFNDQAPETSFANQLHPYRKPNFATNNHGVYVIAHGRNSTIGGLGAMNGLAGTENKNKVGPANLANLIWLLCGGPVEKICVLACNFTMKLPTQGLVGDQFANKYFMVRLCKIFAGQGDAEEQRRYQGGTFKPRIAGWDCLVSICYEGMDEDYDPDGAHSAEKRDHGRKVREGGKLGQDSAYKHKLAFQVNDDGALQSLGLAGWSDKV